MLSTTSLTRVGRNVLSSSSRTFATSLLEQLSLSQLKNEARRRGVSPSGSKATLITRIKHVENRQNSSDGPASIHRRDSSSVNPSQSSAVSASFTGSTLNVRLPDISAPQELPPPHIPFLPDFWDSSRLRGTDAIHHDAKAEAPMRKVLIVGGTSMQHAGGPTYGESDHTEIESSEDKTISAAVPTTSGFWADVAEDIGLPPSFQISTPLIKAREAIESAFHQGPAQQTQKTLLYQRSLDSDEENGVWILLLILGGSWLAGGLFDGSKKTKLSSQT